ncbi:MAG: hypothetical protein ACYDET_03235 [Thermoleophilia bacterium]
MGTHAFGNQGVKRRGAAGRLRWSSFPGLAAAGAGVFFFAVIFVAYAPVVRDPLIRDDYWLLGQVRDVSVPHLWRLAYVQIIYFRPLGELGYWLQWRLFGASAAAAHALSLISGAADACLLYWFMRLLRLERLTALFAALLFALAPIAVEAVTWPAVRFDLNALALMILSLGLYFIFLRDGSRRAYAGALAAALAAMLVKEPAMVMVALVPLLEIVYRRSPDVDAATYRRLGFWRAALRRWLPLAALFLIYLGARIAVLKGLGGAAPVLGPPSARASFFSAMAFAFPYSWLGIDTVRSGWTLALAAAAGITGAGLLAVMLRPRRDRSRRAAAFFGLFFLISLIPVYPFVFMIGITKNLAGSRYLYIPAGAFLAMATVVVFDIGRRSRLLLVAMVVLLAGLSLADAWAIGKNNEPWQAADAVSGAILAQTRSLVPDPAPGAVFYYRDMPVMSGYRVFEHLTLQPALAIAYGRDDIRVYVTGDDFDQSLRRGDYEFGYDRARGILTLLRTPGSAGGR